MHIQNRKLNQSGILIESLLIAGCFHFPLHFNESKKKKIQTQEINQDCNKLLVKTGELYFSGYKAVQFELTKIQAISYRYVKL